MRDTIAAIATPPGAGGVGVIRVSGPQVPQLAIDLLGEPPQPRYAHLCRLRDAQGAAIDQALLLNFPAPHSFTGEDVLELHTHGSPVVLALLLERLHGSGVRPARPGEFSERAFLEGKMDLTQAEAVADLISAGSAAAARAAMRSLDGAFSILIDALLRELIALRVQLEAAIDFPDEEIDILAEAQVQQRLAELDRRIAELRQQASAGQQLRDGIYLVIIGPPNAGKSSLLNALAGSDRAIVTAIPGTTRDVLRESLVIDGVPITVVDTAGLRDSDDPVEREGVRRAGLEAARADHALVVIDDSDPQADPAAFLAGLPDALPVTIVRNKIDLSGRSPGLVVNSAPFSPQPSALSPELAVSCTSGAGLDQLRQHLTGQSPGANEGSFSARGRHLAALSRVADHLSTARRGLDQQVGAELVAEDLRLAQESLAEITGAFNADQLLGEIFSSFCIGK